MLSSLNYNIVSVLGLAAAVSSAPLNDRSSAKRGIVGWLCHYDGPISPPVDISLDLPAMLSALCAKVNFDFPGCESFNPNPAGAAPAPQDDASALGAASANEGDEANSTEDDQDHHNDDNGDSSAESPAIPQLDEAAENADNAEAPSNQGSEDNGEGNVSPNSFQDSGPAEPEIPSPEPYVPEQDPNSAIKSLSSGEGDDSESHDCAPTEHFSTEANRCVDQSSFSPLGSNGTCSKGTLDALLQLCLDISTLGLTEPIHVDASALQSAAGGTASALQSGNDGKASALSSGSDSDGGRKCPEGQQLSSLLSVCIDEKFFSDPLAGHECANGWKLDLVLGNCLNLTGCQNEAHDS